MNSSIQDSTTEEAIQEDVVVIEDMEDRTMIEDTTNPLHTKTDTMGMIDHSSTMRRSTMRIHKTEAQYATGVGRRAI